jgi:hypothetical protein
MLAGEEGPREPIGEEAIGTGLSDDAEREGPSEPMGDALV